MRNYIYSHAAFEDLEELAKRPFMGHRRTGWTSAPVRFWAVRSFVIIYRPDSKPLQVVRIIHGARDVPRVI
jgi:antitoxin ParD1/3/4/toxin ParE1/3/4